MSRVERERAAYDQGSVWEHSHRWHRRFEHVFTSPNTRRHERLFEDLLQSTVGGKRVLEIGCGDGQNATLLLSFGAAFVFGIDVSETFLERAQRRAIPGRLEFANVDAAQPIAGPFDVIVGRGILHHLDYRPVIRRLYDDTLADRGTMIFLEPLGSNPLIRLFRLLVPRAHTTDEQSFTFRDLQWFRQEFPRFEVYPFNLVSLPAGLISSYVYAKSDNALLRASDVIDGWLARKSLWLDSHFRYALLKIQKAADRSSGR